MTGEATAGELIGQISRPCCIGVDNFCRSGKLLLFAQLFVKNNRPCLVRPHTPNLLILHRDKERGKLNELIEKFCDPKRFHGQLCLQC